MFVTCTCGKTLQLPEQSVRRRYQCPACGRGFVHGEAAPAAANSEDSSVSEPSTAIGVASAPSATVSIPSGAMPAVPGRSWLAPLLWLGTATNGLLAALFVALALRPEPAPDVTTASPPPVSPPRVPPPDPPLIPPMPPRAAPRRPQSRGPVVRNRASGFVDAVDVSIAPDGKQVLGFVESDLLLYDVAKPELHRRLKGDAPIHAALFLPDGKRALVSRSNGSIDVVELDGGTRVRSFAARTDQPRLLALSSDGQQAFSSGMPSRQIVYWDVAEGRERGRSEDLPAVCDQLAASADGKRALGRVGGQLFLWDTERGKKPRRVAADVDKIVHAALAGDGKQTALAAGKRLRIWDVDGDAEIAWIEPPLPPVRVAFSPDNRTVIAGSEGSSLFNGKPRPDFSALWFYDLHPPRQFHQVLPDVYGQHTGTIRQFSFTPNGSHVGWLTTARNIHTWQLPAR